MVEIIYRDNNTEKRKVYEDAKVVVFGIIEGDNIGSGIVGKSSLNDLIDLQKFINNSLKEAAEKAINDVFGKEEPDNNEITNSTA